MRMSVRARWAAMFAGVFLLTGTALLMINYMLVTQTVPDAVTFSRQDVTGDPNLLPGTLPPSGAGGGMIKVEAAIGSFRADVMQKLLLASGIALLAAGVVAALLGWLMARQALRPLHTIMATARRLSAESLDRRINLEGPDDELKELADTFDGMLDRLSSAFDGQRRFVANASHELRTPLAVQRTLIEVAMADPTASPELLRLGQHLLHTNERSERLIEGLLVLARSDQGLVTRVPVRLDQVVEGVLRSCTGLAAEQGVTVASRLEPRIVVGDQVLLERLVTNLVQNALHYNEPGGSVLVTVGEHPALVVGNTGPEVPAEALPSLFAPFSRGPDRQRVAGRNGAGLGLSIVRSVASAHHGSVYAEPNFGGGLRITVGFPSERAVGAWRPEPGEGKTVTSLPLLSAADPAIRIG